MRFLQGFQPPVKRCPSSSALRPRASQLQRHSSAEPDCVQAPHVEQQPQGQEGGVRGPQQGTDAQGAQHGGWGSLQEDVQAVTCGGPLLRAQDPTIFAAGYWGNGPPQRRGGAQPRQAAPAAPPERQDSKASAGALSLTEGRDSKASSGSSRSMGMLRQQLLQQAAAGAGGTASSSAPDAAILPLTPSPPAATKTGSCGSGGQVPLPSSFGDAHQQGIIIGSLNSGSPRQLRARGGAVPSKLSLGDPMRPGVGSGGGSGSLSVGDPGGTAWASLRAAGARRIDKPHGNMSTVTGEATPEGCDAPLPPPPAAPRAALGQEGLSPRGSAEHVPAGGGREGLNDQVQAPKCAFPKVCTQPPKALEEHPPRAAQPQLVPQPQPAAPLRPSNSRPRGGWAAADKGGGGRAVPDEPGLEEWASTSSPLSKSINW